jgi:hypothetical protein
VDNYSTANFEDTSGKIFDPEEPGIATVASPTGTSLILSTVDIAKTSFVRTRNFKVRPNAGSVLVTPTVWNVNGDFSKRWLIQAGSGTASIQYTVGDLEPGRPYTVTKNGAGSNFTADGTGTITFTDTGVSTGLTEFVIALNL